MLALIALICFVVGAVKVGTFDSPTMWLFLGLIFIAADMVFTGFGYSYPRFTRRR